MRLQSHSTAGRLAAVFLTASAILIGLAGSARAQQVQGGPTIPVVAAFIRGVDTAAAPNGTYLVVGGQGPIYAVCVNAQGTAISGAMLINATPGGYASFPRAIYSPDVNGGTRRVHGRVGRGRGQSRTRCDSSSRASLPVLAR